MKERMAMKIELITVGMFQSNCFIPYCEEKREAVIIDPGDEGDRILSIVEDKKLEVKYIINTHAHIDHVSALASVSKSIKAPVLMHKEDVFIYENLSYQSSMFGLEAPHGVPISRFLEDGEEILFGGLKLRVIHTPGHSPGSIALIADDEQPWVIFSGDTLFRGSIGRTDLFGGNFDQIMDSLREVFLPLPDDTVVYPGHGEPTTIGEEKLHNPFLIDLH